MNQPLRIALLAGVAVTAALLTGCRSAPHGSGPYQTQQEALRNPMRAQELTLQAANLIAEDPEHAERLLRDALTADLYHGPAHNNLGVILLKQGDLYGAAGEFEWARKLMPGHPDPRVNLALVLERAGRWSDAEANYRAALEASPDFIPAQQALARLIVRESLDADDRDELLHAVALRGQTKHWRSWAAAELARSAE